MGQSVCRLIPDYQDIALVAAIEKSGSELIGKKVIQRESAEESSELRYSDAMLDAVRSGDIVIDFSSPESSSELANLLLEHPKPAAICTTGLLPETIAKLKQVSARVPILIASNTSLGVFAQRQLVSLAAKILGDKFEIEIVESHHRNKKDSPSGTALTLAEEICKHRDLKIVTDRAGSDSVRDRDELGISSVRGGDTIGEHTVYFIANGERLEITHRAFSRDIFARGVLELITILLDRNPGIYNPAELFCLLSPDSSSK